MRAPVRPPSKYAPVSDANLLVSLRCEVMQTSKSALQVLSSLLMRLLQLDSVHMPSRCVLAAAWRPMEALRPQSPVVYLLSLLLWTSTALVVAVSPGKSVVRSEARCQRKCCLVLVAGASLSRRLSWSAAARQRLHAVGSYTLMGPGYTVR